MTYQWANRLVHSRYPLAIVAGLAPAAAFPRVNMAGLAWVAPGLMVAAALGKTGWERFRIGYVAALTYYLAMLHWLLLIPYLWHGIPLGPALGWVTLSGAAALFPALWVWLVQSPESKVQSREDSPQSSVHSPQSGSPEPRTSALAPHGTWFRRTGWALGGAAGWVAFEMITARLLGGFPWDLLGVSQWRMTPLIQIASVTGVYGVSFLIVWFSLSLVSAVPRLVQEPSRRSAWIAELFLPILAVAVVFNLGFRQMRHETPASQTLKVTVVQPSIPQDVIWNPEQGEQRFQELLKVCEQALTNPTDLLLLPESAVPGLLRYDTNTYDSITGLARRHQVWMILCADDAKPRPGVTNATGPEDMNFFNSSFLLSPEGRIAGQYDKRNLVIFGEFVPFEHWLPFMKWFTPVSGGFTPGDRAVPFDLRVRGRGISTSVLICYEDIYPQLGREGVDTNTDFLVNLTNDGWFGEDGAQWQQAAMALFRTVENRVPLIRCTNNGLTCWIDAYGRMRDIFHDGHGSVYGAGFKTFDIPIRSPGDSRSPTFYNQHGDWFGWTCMAVAGLMLGRRILSRVWQRPVE